MDAVTPPTLSGAATRSGLRTSRWTVAAVLLAVVVAGFFDRISISVLFTDTTFQSAMGTGFDPALLGLLMTGFLFAYGASGLLLGFLGDKLGPRRGMLLGGAVWGGLMLVMGGVASYGAMLACRVALGVALGVAEGPQFSFLNKAVHRWFPPRERGRANAVWLAGSPIGSAVGFPLTVALVAFAGWGTSFYVLGAVNLLIMVPLVFVFVQDWPRSTPAAARVAERDGPPFLQAVRLFLGDWRFWLLVLFNACALLYLWGLNGWLPSYLQRVRHFDLRGLGLFASLPFVLMFVGEVPGGALSDCLGRRAAICGAGLLGAAVFVYLTPQATDPVLAALLIAVSAGCWGLALPPLFALSMEIIPRPVIATGVGVFNGVGNLVGACSPLLMGWIIRETGSFDAGLMVLATAGVVGACAMLPLLRRY